MSRYADNLRPGFLSAVVLALAGAVNPAAAQIITEFPVLSSGRLLDLAPGANGMWISENTNVVGFITLDGHFSEFPVNHAARRMVVGSDGNLWFTSSDGFQLDGFLSRMTPSGDVTDFPLTGDPWGIAVGRDGNIWFTEVDKFPNPCRYLGRATMDGRITEFCIDASADSLAVDLDGSLWLPDWTEIGFDAIVRISQSGSQTRFALPGGLNVPGDVGPSVITLGSDGNVWFVEARVSNIGRITPSGAITIFDAPGRRGLAAGDDGNLWFTESNANKIGRLSPFGDYVEFGIPSANAQPWGISAGPDGNIWFTEGGRNQIGRIALSVERLQPLPPDLKRLTPRKPLPPRR